MLVLYCFEQYMMLVYEWFCITLHNGSVNLMTQNVTILFPINAPVLHQNEIDAARIGLILARYRTMNTLCYSGVSHWNENVAILVKFSSLAALEVVILTTCSAASDENLIKTTFSFQYNMSDIFIKTLFVIIAWHLLHVNTLPKLGMKYYQLDTKECNEINEI